MRLRVLTVIRQQPLALLALFVALGGTSVAAVSVTATDSDKESSNVVRGCVGKNTGRLRVVDSVVRCGTLETPISFNRHGQRGAKGPTGKRGVRGTSGANGKGGASGIRGEAGKDGVNGSAGRDGAAGAKGDAGADGQNGATGETGEQGPKGDTGAAGLDGQNGATGETGEQGPKGDTGAAGPDGQNGATGETGERGPKGDTGAPGTGLTATNQQSAPIAVPYSSSETPTTVLTTNLTVPRSGKMLVTGDVGLHLSAATGIVTVHLYANGSRVYRRMVDSMSGFFIVPVSAILDVGSGEQTVEIRVEKLGSLGQLRAVDRGLSLAFLG